jgi:transcriptional regulator with XRE-family HTH domain
MSESFAARLGLNIARARIRADLTQEELSVRASLHRTAVGQLERGERVPLADTVVRIAGSLDVDVGVLLVGLTWTPGETVLGSYGHEADAGP